MSSNPCIYLDYEGGDHKRQARATYGCMAYDRGLALRPILYACSVCDNGVAEATDAAVVTL